MSTTVAKNEANWSMKLYVTQHIEPPKPNSPNVFSFFKYLVLFTPLMMVPTRFENAQLTSHYSPISCVTLRRLREQLGSMNDIRYSSIASLVH